MYLIPKNIKTKKEIFISLNKNFNNMHDEI